MRPPPLLSEQVRQDCLRHLFWQEAVQSQFIERGRDVDRRTADVNRFWTSGQLDITSNVQFGEGGAGTFSDGKLNSGTKI